MVTRINKISAMFATVAIFFFAALSTAQAAIDTTMDLWYQVNIAQYNQDGSPLVVHYMGDANPDPIYSNPWGLKVGDYIKATVAWDSNAPVDSYGAFSYGNWSYSVILGSGSFQETINGVPGASNLLYVEQGNIDYYSMDIPFLDPHHISFLADTDVIIVDDYYYAGTGQLALQAIRTDAPPSAPVPLPSALWLLGSGLIGMVGVRRKMKK